jgi:hypothetical protein
MLHYLVHHSEPRLYSEPVTKIRPRIDTKRGVKVNSFRRMGHSLFDNYFLTALAVQRRLVHLIHRG